MATARRINLSLTSKVLALSLLIGVALWSLLDQLQGRELRADFDHQLREQLELEATVDRRLFDRHVQGLHHSARLIGTQKNILDYLAGEEWRKRIAQGEIRHYSRPPPWLPSSSILRTFFHAHDALLLDPSGQLREVYHNTFHDNGADMLPAALYQPSLLLRKLSHNQAYMTLLDGEPYVITTQDIRGDNGQLQAILLLSTPIDDEFLYAAREATGSKSILALLDPSGEHIIASNDAHALPHGSLVSELAHNYLIIGKSFFDYGASDLELQFASFISTERSAGIIDQLLARESQRRAILALSLILFFTLLTLFITLRVRRLNTMVQTLSSDYLGITTLRGHGDEIRQLENQFKQLTDTLEQARSENVSLHDRIVDSENESRSLRLVTELLSVGVIIDSDNGLTPFNQLMEELVADFGDMGLFLLGDQPHGEVVLTDHHGNRRSFSLDHHEALGPRGTLVRETTVHRQIEAERDLFANFPAFNPHPLLRIDRKGNILYANVAMRDLLSLLDPTQSRRIPDTWQHRLNRDLGKGTITDFEITLGSHTYTFIAAPLESNESVYFLGQDVTEKKNAERELRLAATVTNSVLDGIAITDTDGIVQQLNPAFSEMFGYDIGDLVGQPLKMMYAGKDDDVLTQMWDALSEGGAWQGETWSRHKNGSIIFCLVRINAIHDDNDQVSNYVVVYSDITERKRHEEHLAHMAFHDALTMLPNRSLLEVRLEQNLAQAQRNATHIAVLFLDLDGFKPVNDRYGHAVGDQLLREVAQRLRECVRHSDTVSRVGGDEFVIVLPDFADQTQVREVAQKIISALHTRFLLAGTAIQISTSIGIALYPDDGDNAESLIKAADRAMYRVKESGKDAYGFG